MPHFITQDCVGCTMCLKACPVDGCITGDNKKLHVIAPELCIDCGVCATYCPVACIGNPDGDFPDKIGPKNRPIAIVDIDYCTGCEFCVDVCPFDCLEMLPTDEGGGFFKVAENVRHSDCVACKLCEEVCIKDAITIRWPEGEYCEVVGVDKNDKIAPLVN